MAKFLTDLKTRNISDEVDELIAPLVYESDILGCVLIIPAGFQTDYASVPRVPIVFWFWGGRSHREAVIHDYLYRRDSAPVVSRADADAVFREAMAARQKAAGVRWPMYWGVRLGGWTSYHKKQVGDRLT